MLPALAAVVAIAVVLGAGGSSAAPRSIAVPIVASVKTVELSPGAFTSPWQVAWIPSGTTTGAIAFTDRGGNQVGILDPANFRTQNVRLNNITSPGPIAVVDNTRFAVAGTGGVAIFDRSGSGRVTELVMLNTRNQVLAVGSGNNLLVADAQQHDLRIIRPPYSGPTDITRFPIPPQCRNPTGLIPGTTTIDILCQQTNNIVRINYTGNFGSSTPLPVANSGAQEARPSPTGFVFSGFNASRFFSYSPGAANPFGSFALTGPAVPTVGLFDHVVRYRTLDAARGFRSGRKPPRSLVFNSFTPSFRDGTFSFGSFPARTSSAFTRLAGRNLVGSTNGPGGSIWVADATPGRPALHRIDLGDGTKTGRTKTGYRFSQWFTKPGPDFLARMSMPFTGPVPTDVRVSVTGGSASPWNLKPTFTENFGLKAIVRGALPGAGTYQIKVQSTDTGAYTRAYRFSGLRPGTKNLTLTLTGGSAIPASFKVDAVADTPPCECDSLDVVLRSKPGPPMFQNSVGLGFDWVLECTGGVGACEGSFSITTDKAGRAAGVKLDMVTSSGAPRAVGASDDSLKLTCKGNCTGRTTQGKVSELILRAPKNFGSGIDSVTVVVERTCKRVLAPKIFRIAFGAGGVVSARRSDLNGNGVADGKRGG